FLTDELLRMLVSNKKDVQFETLCEKITAPGLFKLWEDMLEGKFDGIYFNVNDSVSDELFNLLGYSIRKDNCFEDEQVEAAGRIDESKRYEIWRNPYDTYRITMSRIYDDRPWKSMKYDTDRYWKY
ncbi:hypothetical protein PFISCL1PPCAC_21886, partial [Pristionchus fissidentatus]